jgi:hypothetical protein
MAMARDCGVVPHKLREGAHASRDVSISGTNGVKALTAASVANTSAATRRPPSSSSLQSGQILPGPQSTSLHIRHRIGRTFNGRNPGCWTVRGNRSGPKSPVGWCAIEPIAIRGPMRYVVVLISPHAAQVPTLNEHGLDRQGSVHHKRMHRLARYLHGPRSYLRGRRG